jgi:hypothetical protein
MPDRSETIKHAHNLDTATARPFALLRATSPVRQVQRPLNRVGLEQ